MAVGRRRERASWNTGSWLEPVAPAGRTTSSMPPVPMQEAAEGVAAAPSQNGQDEAAAASPDLGGSSLLAAAWQGS